MNEILVALIGAAGLVLVSVIGIRTNGRVKAIQGQVQNDHTTNLREELDERHDETRSWFSALWRLIDNTDKNIAALDARVAALEDKETRE